MPAPFVEIADTTGLTKGACIEINRALQAYERGEGKQSRAQKEIAAGHAERFQRSSYGRRMAHKKKPMTREQKAVQRAKVWRLLNPDKHRGFKRSWARRNREKERAISRAYYLRKRTEILEKKKLALQTVGSKGRELHDTTR